MTTHYKVSAVNTIYQLTEARNEKSELISYSEFLFATILIYIVYHFLEYENKFNMKSEEAKCL